MKNITGDKMKSNLPHITIGQKESDPFTIGERSKTKEHTDRLRSDFLKISENENLQKLTKNED